MPEEQQNIDGLPEGCKLLKLEERVPPLNSYKHFIMYAIVERIPKPKQRVLHAEFIVPEKACTGIHPIVSAEFHMQDDSRETVRDWTPRIEERDA